MILKLGGDVNRYHVETLCLLFFPGSTFSDTETPGEDVPEIEVTSSTEGTLFRATAILKLGGKSGRGEGKFEPKHGESAEKAGQIAVGRAIFAAGKALFSYTPPWGILTGVRPAKVATDLIKKNGITESRRMLRDEFFLKPKKAELAISVSEAERKLTAKLPKNLCSIYIGIPFCPSRCAYCSFVSYTSGKLLSLIDDYLKTLFLDLENIFAVIRDLGLTVASIYVGGGTPTTLSADQMKALLSLICRYVDPSTLMEFTVEGGRPDTITPEKLRVIRECGVGRISVNPQTMQDKVLNAIGRRHTVADFLRAFAEAREAGFPVINVDMIAGLPEDTFPGFSESFDRIMELSPENVTVHTFAVKRSADLRRKDGIYDLSAADAIKSVEYSQLTAGMNGYRPYYMYRQKNTVGNLENVGFARPGTEGYYNIFMMEELHTVFAAGAGAVTKLVGERDPKTGAFRIERIFMPKYPYEYLRDAERLRCGTPDGAVPSYRDRVLAFYERREDRD